MAASCPDKADTVGYDLLIWISDIAFYCFHKYRIRLLYKSALSQQFVAALSYRLLHRKYSNCAVHSWDDILWRKLHGRTPPSSREKKVTIIIVVIISCSIDFFIHTFCCITPCCWTRIFSLDTCYLITLHAGLRVKYT